MEKKQMKTFYNLILGFLVIVLLVAALVVADVQPEWMDGVAGFFEGVTAAELFTYFALGLAAVIPGGFVKFFNWVKSQTGYTDADAQITVILILAGVAVVLNFLVGAYNGSGFVFQNMINFFVEAYVLAGVQFQKMKQG